MQTLIDFLSFKLLISPYVLVIGYYFGAIFIPIVSWYFFIWINHWLRKQWLKNKYPDTAEASNKIRQQFINSILSTENKLRLYSLFFMFFLSMEVIWRMMFEFLIAYFQIRDALLAI
jgi:hypothetical protein